MGDTNSVLVQVSFSGSLTFSINTPTADEAFAALEQYILERYPGSGIDRIMLLESADLPDLRLITNTPVVHLK
jgi:hypothetical protein